ncbi:MAG: hypothetical protein JRH11_20140 [Deltaproteobacteria bacterium]|nr:hypothetical protein [Deltaproteobacteria bacterium]
MLTPIVTQLRFMLLVVLVALIVAVTGCDEEATESSAEQSGPSAAATGTPANPHGGLELEGATPQRAAGSPVGGVGWQVPEPFRSQPPSSSMRVAEYLFPEQAGETPGTLTVFYFGVGQGRSVQANIDRWVGQFTLPAGSEPSIERSEVNGLAVTVIDVTGTYNGGMGSAGGAPSSDQRMLGAIVEGPEGPVFFKMVAEATLAARAVAPFGELVASFHPET